MATVRHNTLWSTCCLLWHHVHICIARNSTGFCAKFWVHELDWGFDTIALSVLPAVVREQVRARASYLRHQRVARRSCTHRSAFRHCTIYPWLYWIANGFWCFSLPTCRKRCCRGPFHEPCVSSSPALFHCLHAVAVVGNDVPFTSLRRGSSRRKLT